MGASAAVDSGTSCPACGGQVHPIAGRCKHCKADLARMRAGAPAAPSRAPARVMALADLKPMTPPPLGGGNGHRAAGNSAASGALPLGMPAPSPVHHGVAASPVPPVPDEAPRRWSTMWPLIVAVVAICAIIASVAMLLFGGDSDKKTSKARRFEGPAPEMMPTDPAPHQVGPQGGGVAPDPSLPRPSMPDPVPPPPPPTLAPSGAAPRDVEDFMRQAVEVGCKRMSTCGGNDANVSAYCSMAPSMVTQMADSLRSSCTDFDGSAGRACIDSIGRLPCPSGGADPDMMAQTLMGLSDCRKVCATLFGGSLGGGVTIDPDDLYVDPDDNDPDGL